MSQSTSQSTVHPRRSRSWAIWAVVAVVAVIGSVLLFRPFSLGAQEASPSAEQLIAGKGRTPAERLTWRDDLYADLGTELGVSAEEVDQAVTNVLGDRLDEKVASGDLTADEAAEILSAWEAGERSETVRARLEERFGGALSRLRGD